MTVAADVDHVDPLVIGRTGWPARSCRYELIDVGRTPYARDPRAYDLDVEVVVLRGAVTVDAAADGAREQVTVAAGRRATIPAGVEFALAAEHALFEVYLPVEAEEPT